MIKHFFPFHVYRCLEGERAGNVDFLGRIDAISIDDAERRARDRFDLSINEHFDIQRMCTHCMGIGFIDQDGECNRCSNCDGSGELE